MNWLNRKKIRMVFIVYVTAIVLGDVVSVKGDTITVGLGVGYDFDNIQAGIDAANDGDEVLVAPGEYVITEPVTFKGKAITVISEAGPKQTTIRMDTPVDPNRGSVIAFENGETDASVLEGFSITGGSGCIIDDDPRGGGILFDASSGTVVNCAIVQNSTENGGGVFCAYPCSPRLIDCIIANNSASDNGGGLFTWLGSSPTITNCIIKGNSARFTGGWGGIGGGVACYRNSSATMANCTVVGNTARAGGGLLCGEDSSMIMTHCLIIDNVARIHGGGGLETFSQATVTVANCVIVGNTTLNGGGIACVPYGSQGNSITVTNSIIRGNNASNGHEIFVGNLATFSISYSNVVGGQTGIDVTDGGTLNWGAGNIDADPLFAELGYWVDINDPNIVVEPDDPNAVWIEGDYHLKSEAGRWDPESETWVQDVITSPCIDRGDPNSPVAFEPDPNGGLINIGAYGGTYEASLSIGMIPPLEPPLVAYWKLDETDGTIAYDSAFEHNGTLNGEPLWLPEGGFIDGAIELDGIDDYIITPRVLPGQPDAFSIFVWIKGGEHGQMILSQVNGSDWLAANSTNGSLMTELTFISKPSQTLSSQAVITDGQWHRVGLVWDGSNRMLYVDDTEVASDTHEAGWLFGDLQIGTGNKRESGTFWSGLIDDVRIYNRAVTP